MKTRANQRAGGRLGVAAWAVPACAAAALAVGCEREANHYPYSAEGARSPSESTYSQVNQPSSEPKGGVAEQGLASSQEVVNPLGHAWYDWTAEPIAASTASGMAGQALVQGSPGAGQAYPNGQAMNNDDSNGSTPPVASVIPGTPRMAEGSGTASPSSGAWGSNPPGSAGGDLGGGGGPQGMNSSPNGMGGGASAAARSGAGGLGATPGSSGSVTGNGQDQGAYPGGSSEARAPRPQQRGDGDAIDQDERVDRQAQTSEQEPGASEGAQNAGEEIGQAARDTAQAIGRAARSTAKEARRAGGAAEATTPVRDLYGTDADKALGERVRAGLQANALTAQVSERLHLDIDQGVVTVTGIVMDARDRQNVAAVITNVAGQGQVRDLMSIQNLPQRHGK